MSVRNGRGNGFRQEGRGIEMAVFRLSALDEKINTLTQDLIALTADYERQKLAMQTRLARLQAVRAKITPEMEQLLTQLNAALE